MISDMGAFYNAVCPNLNVISNHAIANLTVRADQNILTHFYCPRHHHIDVDSAVLTKFKLAPKVKPGWIVER